MRKGIVIGFMGFISAGMLWCNPVEVNAESYYWATAQDESGETVDGWYQGERPGSVDSIKLEGMPDVQPGDFITLDTVPDEECAEWLKSLNGDLNCIVTSFVNTDIQLGNPESEDVLKLSNLNAYNGNITLYGDTEYMRVGVGDLTVDGDVEIIALGDFQSVCGRGNVNVSGNVEVIDWYPETDYGNYAVGFGGSIKVDGTVTGGKVYGYEYDSAVDKNVWRLVKNIEKCNAGVFQMTDGVLAQQVPTTDAAAEEVVYRYQYSCSGADGWNRWIRQAYNAETGVFAYSEECTVDDIEEGAYVSIYSTGTTNRPVINVNLGALSMYAEGDSRQTAYVTVNGDVDTLYVNSATKSAWDITINGDVETADVYYFYNPNHNLTVTGDVVLGHARADYKYLGYFICSNMQIIKSGNWNPELYMTTGGIGYQPVSKEELGDVLEDENIGEEVTVSTDSGEVTLVKDAQVAIMRTGVNVLKALAETEGVKNALDALEEKIAQNEAVTVLAETLMAIDIDITTLYRNAVTNAIYTEDENYGEKAITQLAAGKSLSFTIKIPVADYDETASYVVMRHHEDEDGNISDEVLETAQDGNALSFASDKFSTFVVVKVTKAEVPKDKVYAFVERMYTVALGRDAEEGGATWWTEELLAGNSDGAGLAQGFLNGKEFAGKEYNNEKYVEVLYATFFDRETAEGEGDFWVNALNAGTSRESVLSGFVNSEEFFALCAEYGILRGVMQEDGIAVNAGIGKFAERLYTEVLRRDGEEGGMEYWASSIAKREHTPEDAAKSFFTSPEYLAKNTGDEEYLEALYRTFMGRDGDEEGMNFWLSSMAAGTDNRASALGSFAASDEFKQIMASYGL